MKESSKVRLDELILERGLAESRHGAQIIIRLGWVYTEDRRLDKPGMMVRRDVELRIEEMPRYVSRGGFKLRGALDELDLDVEGWMCLDVGVSTGGFSDCLLQGGARCVIGVDVGENLVHEKLLRDSRFTFLRKNARYLVPTDLAETVDLVTVDVSFISVTKLVQALTSLVKPGGKALVLVKPQFELERFRVRKGVVRDPVAITEAVERVRDAFVVEAWEWVAGTPSRVKGPKGNQEQFLLMRAAPL